MAERRMFAKKIINSARFLTMPPSSRLLYYDLGMQADDDGVVEAYTVMRMTGAVEDDLKVLVSKGFVTLLNQELVAYITDWSQNNQVRMDRYHPSMYQHLLVSMSGKPTVNQWLTNGKPRLGKDRLGKDRLGKDRLEEPLLNSTDVELKSASYCAEPQCVSTPQTSPAAILLTLNDKTEYPVTQEQVDKWTDLFPNVDVMQQLRTMAAWLDANPGRRKTRRGVTRFIVAWLSREQDKGHRAARTEDKPFVYDYGDTSGSL